MSLFMEEVVYLSSMTGKEYNGYFLAWGCNSHDYAEDNYSATYSAAIIMKEDGGIALIHAENVFFENPEKLIPKTSLENEE